MNERDILVYWVSLHCNAEIQINTAIIYKLTNILRNELGWIHGSFDVYGILSRKCFRVYIDYPTDLNRDDVINILNNLKLPTINIKS
jgi:hypothetical protein